MRIRPAKLSDIEAIRGVIRGAFAAKSHLSNKESDIVDALREDGKLAISLVAVEKGEAVGHVAVSPVRIQGSNGWYGLGPVAVHPDRQGRGIGTQLVTSALTRLREEGAVGCVVLGRPEFYQRFGFSNEHRLGFEGAPRKFLMALEMKGSVPEGEVKYHEAFDIGH